MWPGSVLVALAAGKAETTVNVELLPFSLWSQQGFARTRSVDVWKMTGEVLDKPHRLPGSFCQDWNRFEGCKCGGGGTGKVPYYSALFESGIGCFFSVDHLPGSERNGTWQSWDPEICQKSTAPRAGKCWHLANCETALGVQNQQCKMTTPRQQSSGLGPLLSLTARKICNGWQMPSTVGKQNTEPGRSS